MNNYRLVKVKDYTVSLNAEYNITVDTDDLFEAEDKAIETIEAELTKRDVEEVDSHIIESIESIKGYIIKTKVNMVVPCVASSYAEAMKVAETFIDEMNLPEGISFISVGAWDSALADEKAFLLRCKGA